MIDEAGSNVPKSFQMVVARLGDLVGMFLKGERLDECDADEFDGIR